MSESIVIDPNEVKNYVGEIRRLADANKDALGFLPASVYRESAIKGDLWVAVDRARKVRGYLLFGGRFPRLRVFQIFVRPEFRGSGTARTLLEKLRDYGERFNYLTITARVARELEANKFWKTCGFLVTDRIPGEATRRPLNKYTLELDVPSLFRGESLRPIDSTQIRYPGPILSTPLYVIDLNVFFDVLRNRDEEESSLVLSLGLNSEVRLRVTSEFVKELERHTADHQPDPVLEFARRLPTLPDVDPESAKPIVEDLRTLLWPGTRKTGRQAANDASDLIHLASCIHHKAYGFVTRDATILQRAADLHQKYDGIRIVSPADLSDYYSDDAAWHEPKLAVVDQRDIEITDLDERNRKETEEFLSGLGVDTPQILSCLEPGPMQRPRLRRIVRVGSRLVGIGSWEPPGPSQATNIYLYVDEAHPNSERAVDLLFLESLMHGNVDGRLRRLDLHASRSQEKTREVAVHIGFRPPKHEGGSSGALAKVSFRGVVGASNWSSFRRDLKATTDCELQEDAPSWSAISDAGIVMNTGQRDRSVTISPFDLETLASPCALILPGRTAVMIPIMDMYTELISSPGRQRSLLPDKEAAFRLERAYFLAAGKHGLLPGGTIVVFYVSRPRSEAVALARVTFSDTLTKTQAVIKLRRQGVLSEKDIDQRARRGKITAFTFDNLLKFRTNVPYQDLKRYGCVNKANLVTAQPLTHQALVRIVNRAFGVKF